MVTARSVNNRLDTPMHTQKRRVLPSGSSQTHLGRRGETSITSRISWAILKMTLFPCARMHYTTPSCSESITFITVFHAERHWPMKYTKKIELSTLHHPCPGQYSLCMRTSPVRMNVLKQSSSHSMIKTARHWKTNEKRMKMYKKQSMLINHTLTKAKVRFIKLHKRVCTSTTSNICIKTLRLQMKLKHVKSWEHVCKSKTLYISSLADARTCFMTIRGIERRPTKTITFHNP